MFRLFLDTGFYSISFPANRQVSTARYNSPNRLFPAYFPRNAFLYAGADYPSGTIIYLCAFSVKRYSRFFLSLTELVKKGELTVEQGKVLNEELKHNIKDAIRENVTIVTPPDDVISAVDSLSDEQLEALKAHIAAREATKKTAASAASDEPTEN